MSVSDYTLADLSNGGSDVRQFVESARYDIETSRYGDAAASLGRVIEAAERTASAARDLLREVVALPPHRCECCGEAVHTVDAFRLCPSCGARSPDERHRVLSERVERMRRSR